LEGRSKKTTGYKARRWSYHPQFQGHEIANLPSHAIVKMGICQTPEGRQIFSNMTVLENPRLGAYYRPADHSRKEMSLVFSLFPLLLDRLNQKARSLSGEEQQMFCIGRALMGAPELMLLDEPSLG
jgi:branched-chain amino acid transport system ATP-binding protein